MELTLIKLWTLRTMGESTRRTPADYCGSGLREIGDLATVSVPRSVDDGPGRSPATILLV
jgi:hypothetical protein